MHEALRTGRVGLFAIAAGCTAPGDDALVDSATGGGLLRLPETERVVAVCHARDEATLFVAGADVRRHLRHGDRFGPCAEMTEALLPPSHSVVDCRGATLSATAPGDFDPGDPDDDADDMAIPSDPPVAILLWDVRDVIVRNCAFRGGFDFGIYAALSEDGLIRGNDVEAAGTAVTLLASEGFRVLDNELSGEGNAGVRVERGRHNEVAGNTIHVGTGTPTSHRPGHPEPFSFPTGLAFFSHPDWSATLIVNDEVLQVPMTLDTSFAEDNVAAGNDIVGVGTGFGAGAFVRSRGTTFLHNTVSGTEYAFVTFGFGDNVPVFLPGTCADDPDRICQFEDPELPVWDDCNIPGVDAVDLGPCTGTSIGWTGNVWDGRVQDLRVVGNHASHVGVGVSLNLTRNAQVIGNHLRGGDIGVEIGGYSPEDARVEGNVLDGFGVGFALWGNEADHVGMEVTRNDVLGSQQPVVTDTHYVARLDGNYWGVDRCPAFDPADTTDPLVADCEPATAPVAGGAPSRQCPENDALRSLCRFDAPSAVHGFGTAAVEVSFRYDGPYGVVPHGPVPATSTTGAATERGVPATFEFAVPPGTVHLRVAVDGKSRDDLDVFVYGQSTEYGDGSFTEGPHEVVDMPDPPADTYTVEVWPTIVDGHDAPFRLRWWVVPDESTWNVTAAPPKATRGASGIVRLTPPSPAGEWVGTIEHRTGPGQALRPTIVAVSPER